MWRYILVRFFLIIPTVIIVVTVVFFLTRFTGDPITAALGDRLPPDQLAERIAAAGYDRPIIVQYLEYLGGVFRGDFGTTITDNRPVGVILLTYGTATLELVVLRADRRAGGRHPARSDRGREARPRARCLPAHGRDPLLRDARSSSSPSC